MSGLLITFFSKTTACVLNAMFAFDAVTVTHLCSLHKKLSDSGKIDMTSSQSDDAERLAQALRVAHEHSHVQETNARRQEADCKRLREKNER